MRARDKAERARARQREANKKKELIRKIRCDRTRGMSQAAIAEKYGVTRGFVAYHTGGKAYELARQRREREKQVDVECAECGDPRRLTVGALNKRERLGMGPYTCRPCSQYGHAEVKPILVEGDEWRRPEEIVDGEHGIRHWAWQVVKSMTPAERKAVALMDVSVLRDVDDSRPARHARPRREKEEFRPFSYAKLEQPFGAAARGEREAA